MWETATGKDLRRIPLEMEKAQPNPFGQKERGPVVALSPDGRTLAVASKATFRLWNLDTGKERAQPEGSRDYVAALAFAAKGDQLVTAALDAPLLLWETGSGKILRQFTFPNEVEEKGLNNFGVGMRVNQVQARFTPDGKTVVGLHRGKTLRHWDAATGKLVPWTKEAKRVSNFAYAPNGRTVALTGEDGIIRLVDPATGKERRQLVWATMQKMNPQFGGGGVLAIQSAYLGFTADGRTIIVAGFMLTPGGLDAAVGFFEAATGQARLKFDSKYDVGRGNGLTEMDSIAAALDQVLVAATTVPDGRLLATAGFSNIKVWDLTLGKEARLFGGQGVAPWTAAFSPDGKWLIAGRQDGTLRVWDLKTSRILADVPLHDVAITALAFAPDGKTLATGPADTTVLLWDWASRGSKSLRKRPCSSLSLWRCCGRIWRAGTV